MAYNYALKDLLRELEPHAPQHVEIIRKKRSLCIEGMLSVGLKLHCLDGGCEFHDLIGKLGGYETIINANFFRRAGDYTMCWVLPPVGSAQVAILLLEAIEIATGAHIFGNKNIQIQVCSPARLSCDGSALLTIGFCLASDQLRWFSPKDLETTFSDNAYNARGRRIVIHDAAGTFERNFKWWRKQGGGLKIDRILPFRNGRTDILTATSRTDIENINRLSTLLVHAEYRGWWEELGNKFIYALWCLLDEHALLHLVEAPWVRTSEPKTESDEKFSDALRVIMAYAFEDAGRIRESSYVPEMSILFDVQELLVQYRNEMFRQTTLLAMEGKYDRRILGIPASA